jgi:hypothetical protein
MHFFKYCLPRSDYTDHIVPVTAVLGKLAHMKSSSYLSLMWPKRVKGSSQAPLKGKEAGLWTVMDLRGRCKLEII